jgi:hypothetical protein
LKIAVFRTRTGTRIGYRTRICATQFFGNKKPGSTGGPLKGDCIFLLFRINTQKSFFYLELTHEEQELRRAKQTNYNK